MDSLFQDRTSFNEPLHWDTSSVTTMQSLFSVRRSDSNPGGPNLRP